MIIINYSTRVGIYSLLILLHLVVLVTRILLLLTLLEVYTQYKYIIHTLRIHRIVTIDHTLLVTLLGGLHERRTRVLSHISLSLAARLRGLLKLLGPNGAIFKNHILTLIGTHELKVLKFLLMILLLLN